MKIRGQFFPIKSLLIMLIAFSLIGYAFSVAMAQECNDIISIEEIDGTYCIKVTNIPSAVSSFGFDVVYNESELTYNRTYSYGNCLISRFDMVLVNPKPCDNGQCKLTVGGFGVNAVPAGSSGCWICLDFTINNPNPDNPPPKICLTNLVDNMAGWCYGCGDVGCPNCCCGPVVETICDDGIDNDRDQLIDCDDPDCTGLGCDDGDACTTGDTCSNRICVGAPLFCPDTNLCTEDSCDPASGCVHTPIDCDDRNFCTEDSCDPASGCVHTPIPGCGEICNNSIDDDRDQLIDCDDPDCNGLGCDDGDACTTNETCSNRTCVGGTPLVCADRNLCTDDSCNSATGCVYTPRDCDDRNVCTADSCNPASGCVHTAIDCDDRDACTADSCNPASGCVHTAIPGCKCDVTLSVGKAETKSGGNAMVDVSLDNQNDNVRGIQVDICEVNGNLKCLPPPPEKNCLICTGCEVTGRTSGFICVTNERENGCCGVVLVSKEGDLIGKGTGPVFNLKYDVSEDCPGGCTKLNPENVKVSDPLGNPLDVCTSSGEVCFKACGDIYPEETSPGVNNCGNGIVDIFDVIEEIDIALGIGTHSNCQLTKGDVPTGTPPRCSARDGEIDIFDIIVIIDVVLERDNCCLSSLDD